MAIIHQILPLRIRAVVDILTSFLAISFAIVLLWKGGASAIKSVKVWEHASTLWAPPLYPFRTMLPLGVLFIVNMEMAYLTPPFGFNLFYMKAIVPSSVTMGDIYKSVAPFVAIQALCLVLLVLFPQLVLWLPGAVMK